MLQRNSAVKLIHLDLKALHQQAKHPKAEIRFEAVKAIGVQRIREARHILSQALADRDPLVRAQAAESLGWIKDGSATDRLTKVLQSDPNELVRAYAASALGHIGKRAIAAVLERTLRNERNTLVRAHLYGALVKLRKDHLIMSLYPLLIHSRYHVRCTTAHLLAEVSSYSNARLGVEWLKAALRYEKTRAAQSSIRSSLRELCRRFKI